MKTIGIGTTFRYAYADSNPKWTVVSRRGPGTWNCEIREDLDWKGAKKVFGTEEIRQSIGMSEMFKNLAKKSHGWWESRKIGEIVHYHNGFSQYIRGVIIKDGGETKMRPIAMIGEWRQYDLPRRMADGEILKGYHAEKIEKGEAWAPHESCVYESDSFSKAAYIDPRNLPALDLSVPEMTPEEEKEAAKHKLVKAIQAAVSNYKNAGEALAKVRGLLK